MKHSKIEERSRDEKRAHVIRTAEEVLAQAYRGASRQEMIESQLRVRQSVVREIKRRQT
jgi:hypothetical protein